MISPVIIIKCIRLSEGAVLCFKKRLVERLKPRASNLETRFDYKLSSENCGTSEDALI